MARFERVFERIFRGCGVTVPDILLPAEGIDLSKWAVVACDQFTAEPEYWRRVAETVGGEPSTYHITFPEAFLSEGMGRVQAIHSAMRGYLERGVLREAVHGFVLAERQTATGNRLGMVLAVDLEAYDFSPGARGLIRPTEGTILERIPPRVRIREGGPLETPHVMLLVDDPERTLIEPLHADRAALRPLYDVELMQDGGSLRGWAVEEPERLAGIASALERLAGRSGGLLFAVGDGNHSLATARQCWLNLRERLTLEQRERHPARFALAEVVNLHDEALAFEPIHRVLFRVSPGELGDAWVAYARAGGLAVEYQPPAAGQPGGVFLSAEGSLPWRVSAPRGVLAAAIVQDFLDGFLAGHPGAEIDYIHGAESVRALCAARDTAGCLLPALDKAELFPAVRAGGVLPRKTFSMGEAREKRYYMECRRIE